MTSFGTYLTGVFIFVFGVALAAHLLGAPTLWIGVGVIIVLGIGVLTATSRTKRRDPPEPPGSTP